MAVNRNWENEDIMWVCKDFCSDIGRWALHTWGSSKTGKLVFGEMEYREFLVDIISMIAIKRGETSHDTKLISLILSVWKNNPKRLTFHRKPANIGKWKEAIY